MNTLLKPSMVTINNSATKTSRRSTRETKLMKMIKAPIRALIKFKDMYVKSMTEFSGNFEYGVVMGCPAAQVTTTLPRSFSTSSAKSGTGEYSDLVRAASARRLGNMSTELLGNRTPEPMMAKSRSVAVATIDEDKPCEFGPDMIPRSRSYAVHHRRRMV